MQKKLKDIKFPANYSYSSDSEHIPLEFYTEVFSASKYIDILLGYFSSSAIKTIASSFAEFIYNEGSLRLITNQFYRKNDYENLIEDFNINFDNEIIDIFSDIEKLKNTLSKESQHFFDCLKYLKAKGRLQLKPVKFGENEMSHQKLMLFNDGENSIMAIGSINFTLSALIKNSEKFQVEAPWNNDLAKIRINSEIENFNRIFNDNHPEYRELEIVEIEKVIDNVGNSKELKELLDDSLKLNNSEFSKKVKNILEKKEKRFYDYIKQINEIEKAPHFPYFKGKIGVPRQYQIDAYNNWKENDYKGIFAMATGTGKTKTALYVLLQEFSINNVYKCIILVPTQILVYQWENECKEFNFSNVFTSYNSNWKNKIRDIKLQARLGINTDFIFITTYANYNSENFQTLFKNFVDSNLILIADEAHNLGTNRSVKNYLFNIQKRIGLTATPHRNFDEIGSKEIEKYFDSYSPKYTFNYSMLKAIENGYLTKYFYYPKFVTLNEKEMEIYAEYTEKLLKFFDFEKGTFRDGATNLLIQRKRVVHQAENKKKTLVEILKKLKEKNISHTIVYVPEGFEPDYSEKDNYLVEDDDARIIDEYNQLISKLGIKTHQVIGGMSIDERKIVLDQFEKGIIQVLTAMKTLDEGVDIPATKCAIFCASTGNPRQFIQRRGRILRNFEGKEFATVYDLIIEPNDISYWNFLPKDKREKIQRMEINIFRSELYRVANFIYASENRADLFLQKNDDVVKIVVLCEKYNTDIFGLINNLIELDKT